MTETEEAPLIVACKFKWSERTYDYLARFDVKPGDKVLVDGRNGEVVVEVVEIKNESEMAEKFIKGFAPVKEEPKVPEVEEGE